ncbi:MAG: hypothetical protein GXC73_12590 [Chitinophagaceae bacterium]|nr:hypothetical protein [Chitinophagaceae bacterium]
MSWKKVKLGDLCDMNSGGTPRRNNPDYYNGNIPWAKISDIESANGFIETTEEKISIEALQSIGNRIFPKGTLLLAMYGSVGKTAITGIEMSTNQAILGIRPKDESQIYLPYLKHWFHFIKESLMHRAVGGTLQNISLGIVKELQIPLPPLPIQQKIAAILDQADALRKKDRELLAKYDELLQAVFYDMFGDPVKNEKEWEKVKLDSICEVGSSKRVFVEELVEKGIPFYRGTEIGLLGAGEKITPSLFITKEHYEKLKIDTGVPQIGDLLMPSICPDGRIHEVLDNSPFYFKDGRVLWIKVDKKNINGVYLKYFLKGLFAVNYSKIASGTTFAELKIFILKAIEVSLPPLSLQNKFAALELNIRLQKQYLIDQLDKSENLFQSLLQQAFKGELVKA